MNTPLFNDLENPLLGSNFRSDDYLHSRKPSTIKIRWIIIKFHTCLLKANYKRHSTNNLKGALENVEKAYKYAIDYHLEHLKFFFEIFRIRGDIKRLMGDFEGGLVDLNKAHELAPTNKFILQARGLVKIVMEDYVGALIDLDKANDLAPNNNITLKIRGDVKRRMNDYIGALLDLDKANELAPNDNFTLQIRGSVKAKLGDDMGALIDLNQAKKLKPNIDIFTLTFSSFPS